MVGLELPTVTKPSRSDEVMDPKQQLRMADQVQAHFESITPKRPTKPNRSEPDPDASLANGHSHSGPIPELQRLHSLKTQSQVVLPTQGQGAVQEEFVETEYYKQLEFIDKQHHTTGTGFIRVENGVQNGQNHELQRLCDSKVGGFVCKSNPATNDWTPRFNSDDRVVHVSDKPSRSG